LRTERRDRRPPAQLVRMIEFLQADRSLDIDLIPAAVYWAAPRRRRARG